jgi:fibrillarin-like pre-rRNA processing protein
MKIKSVSECAFLIDGKLATLNLAKGQRVYGEELIIHEGREYRLWNPYRSKLAAAIMKGMRHIELRRGDNVLYLGAATGTTSSHISDMVGSEGTVYCVEISERSMRDLLRVCEARENMLPMLKDAMDAMAYSDEVGTVDVIYQDVAAKDQAEILLRNSELLKSGGIAYVAIKSQSISISRAPSEVYGEFLEKVSRRFEILERIDIEPYDSLHLFVVLRKR